jgi:PAS domain-containing protein
MQADEALVEHEELFKNIFFNSPIAILLYDNEGLIIKVNKACLDMVGLSDVEDTRRWPSLFDQPWMPDEAKVLIF